MVEADHSSGRQELGHPWPCRGCDNARYAAVPDGSEDGAGDSEPVQSHLGEAEPRDGGPANKYDASVPVPVEATIVVTAGIDEYLSAVRHRCLSVPI